MPDFGFWELTLTALVALLVVGPDRLPRLAKTAGHWIGRIKHMALMFKSEFMHEADKTGVKKILDETRTAADEAQQEIRHLDPLTKAMDEQISSGRFVKDDAVEDDDRKDSGTAQGAQGEGDK